MGRGGHAVIRVEATGEHRPGVGEPAPLRRDAEHGAVGGDHPVRHLGAGDLEDGPGPEVPDGGGAQFETARTEPYRQLGGEEAGHGEADPGLVGGDPGDIDRGLVGEDAGAVVVVHGERQHAGGLDPAAGPPVEQPAAIVDEDPVRAAGQLQRTGPAPAGHRPAVTDHLHGVDVEHERIGRLLVVGEEHQHQPAQRVGEPAVALPAPCHPGQPLRLERDPGPPVETGRVDPAGQRPPLLAVPVEELQPEVALLRRDAGEPHRHPGEAGHVRARERHRELAVRAGHGDPCLSGRAGGREGGVVQCGRRQIVRCAVDDEAHGLGGGGGVVTGGGCGDGGCRRGQGDARCGHGGGSGKEGAALHEYAPASARWGRASAPYGLGHNASTLLPHKLVGR